MNTQRVRTIAGAAAHFRADDPHTAVTQHAIRKAVITKAVPSVRVGSKYLVAIEALEQYFAGNSTSTETV